MIQKKKILILGSSGGLGQQLTKDFLKTKYKIFSLNRNFIDVEKKLKKLNDFILKTKPGYIIYCIAKTGTEPCESNPLLAINVNSLFPFSLVKVAHKIKAKLIHFSTDAVFYGRSKNKIYSESDQPSPITIYGQSKFLGEILIKKYSNVLIIRLPILFGLTQKNQIIDRLVSKLFKDEKIKVSSDVFSTPLYNRDVSNFIMNLIEKKKFNFFINKCNGIIHLSSGKYISLLNLMLKIGKTSKRAKLIRFAKEKDFKSKILKPQYLGLKTNYQNYIMQVYKIGFKAKLKEYIHEFYKNLNK